MCFMNCTLLLIIVWPSGLISGQFKGHIHSSLQRASGISSVTHPCLLFLSPTSQICICLLIVNWANALPLSLKLTSQLRSNEDFVCLSFIGQHESSEKHFEDTFWSFVMWKPFVMCSLLIWSLNLIKWLLGSGESNACDLNELHVHGLILKTV